MAIRHLLILPLIAACLFCTACKQDHTPDDQKALQKILEETKAAYQDAGTDVQRDNAVADRNTALHNMAATPGFIAWICEVENVTTKGGPDSILIKQKIAVVTLDCGGFEIANSSGTFANLDKEDGMPENAIIEGSPVYKQVIGLNKGDPVSASGAFMIAPDGAVSESSLTESGGMNAPEFAVKFNAINLIED